MYPVIIHLKQYDHHAEDRTQGFKSYVPLFDFKNYVDRLI